MRILWLALVVLCLPTCLWAGPAQQVSREHWSYDLLGSLATQGLVPGKSARDFSLLYQYSRGEMAQMVADSIEEAVARPDLPAPARSSLRKLAVEYRAEPALAGRDLPELAPTEPLLITPSAQLDLQVFSDSEADEGARGELRLSVFEDLAFPDTFFDAQLTAGRDPMDLMFGDKNRPRFSRATLHTHHSWFDFEVGRQQVRWGPGYLSSTSLSDLSRPPYLARFSTDIRIGNLRMPYEQFIGAFSDQGMRKYIIGRRLEVPISSRFRWGLGEFAKSARWPHPATYVLPLQAAQEWFIKKEVGASAYENVLNIAMTTDVSYRFSRRLEAYAEWTLDDARISFMGFGGASVPYKAAYLVGLHSSDLLGTGRTAGRLEYAFTNGQTYLHRDSRMSLFHEGVPMGHSMGPDSDALFVRLDHRLSDRDSAVLHVRRDHHGRHTAATQTDTLWDLTYTRDVTPNAFVTGTVQHFDSDNVGNTAGASSEGTRAVVTASGRY